MIRMPAARNALRVLTLLAEQVGPVRAATVARELGIPRSSAYQLLQVMREEGFLVHYPELGAFGPSSRVREIGSRVGAATRLERLGQPVLDRVVGASAVPTTAHLAVLAGSDIVYAARAQGARSPTTVSKVGVRLPALHTATGRALLAALPYAQVLAVLPDTAGFGGSVPSRAELRAVLKQAASRGYATETGDVDSNYGSVAAAAFDASGYPAAAVGLTFRLASVGQPEWLELGSIVARAASDLTGRLGGSPESRLSNSRSQLRHEEQAAEERAASDNQHDKADHPTQNAEAVQDETGDGKTLAARLSVQPHESENDTDDGHNERPAEEQAGDTENQ